MCNCIPPTCLQVLKSLMQLSGDDARQVDVSLAALATPWWRAIDSGADAETDASQHRDVRMADDTARISNSVSLGALSFRLPTRATEWARYGLQQLNELDRRVESIWDRRNGSTSAPATPPTSPPRSSVRRFSGSALRDGSALTPLLAEQSGSPFRSPPSMALLQSSSEQAISAQPTPSLLPSSLFGLFSSGSANHLRTRRRQHDRDTMRASVSDTSLDAMISRGREAADSRAANR